MQDAISNVIDFNYSKGITHLCFRYIQVTSSYFQLGRCWSIWIEQAWAWWRSWPSRVSAVLLRAIRLWGSWLCSWRASGPVRLLWVRVDSELMWMCRCIRSIGRRETLCPVSLGFVKRKVAIQLGPFFMRSLDQTPTNYI